MTRDRSSRKQVSYTTSKRRRVVELRSGTTKKVWTEVKALSKILSDSDRLKTELPGGTMERVNLLPDYIKEYFRKDGLIEGAKSKDISLGKFLEEYNASWHTDVSIKKRTTNYILDYLSLHTRLNEITPSKAAGIVPFWANDRKGKGKRGGKLSATTITKFLPRVKTAFDKAVEWGYLERSPFANVNCENVETNKKRHCTVTLNDFYAAVDCLDNVELRGILAFARLAGLRPSEIKHLRFRDFETAPNGREFFRILVKGKTGTRIVPLYDSLCPFYDALVAAKKEGQFYLFEKYRTRKNVATSIKKKMLKAGLEPWGQFFVNLRRTCINEKREKGFKQQERTAVFGNSPLVRAKNYDGDLTVNDIALLGIENIDSGVLSPMGIPAISPSSVDPVVPETFEVELFHFGLPNHERYFPTFFPTLSSDSASVWEMLDNGAYWKEVIVAALLRVGYSGKAAWEIADNDKYAFDFYSDLIYCREKIYNYQRQRISYAEMLGSVVAFCYKNFCRAWQGSVISRECLSTGSLDKMAGAGLEPATLRL